MRWKTRTNCNLLQWDSCNTTLKQITTNNGVDKLQHKKECVFAKFFIKMKRIPTDTMV
jgi:hypothetical protein